MQKVYLAIFELRKQSGAKQVFTRNFKQVKYMKAYIFTNLTCPFIHAFWHSLKAFMELSSNVHTVLTEECRQFYRGKFGRIQAKITCSLGKNIQKSLQKPPVPDL